MPRWVFSFRRAQASRMAKLREHAPNAVVVGETGDLVWARTEGSREEAAALLSLLPMAELFEIVGDDHLRPFGRIVPSKRLPLASFTPLEKSLEIRLPKARLPGAVACDVPLRLVRSASVPEGEALLLSGLDDLRAFADGAPSHRLAPLTFVVSQAGEVLLRGTPLPSVPGERFLLRSGIATPFGLSWAPALAPVVVREWLGLGDGSIALFRRDGSLSEIAQRAFVPLSRSSLHELRLGLPES